MIKKIFAKQVISIMTFVFAFVVLYGIITVSATDVIDTEHLFGGGDVTELEIQTATGLGNEDPRTIIASVINVALGFLGIIAVLLILAGGFKWMTAAGNDEAISSAKNLMVAGVVGLIIVLSAFGIARFVVELQKHNNN